MKKLNELQSYLTRLRGLMLTLVILLTIGSGIVWADVTDEIIASNLDATSTTYTNFSDVSITSDAKYAGNSAKNGSNIQLRSKNSNSGIVSTTSGGKVKSVKITVASGSNTVDVYGKNSAYSAASDLYSSSTQGTQLGSLSATGTITVTGDYTYVGIRSNSGAVYLSSVEITWSSGGSSCSECTYYVYNGSTWVSIGTTRFDDVVLAPPSLENNGHGAGNGCWVTDKTIYDGGGCTYSPSGDKYRYVPNPGGAEPDADNKPGSGTCKLYAVYYDDYGCLSTTVTAVQCARIWEEPDNLAVSSVSSTGATLSWDAIDGVSSYHVIVTKVSNSSIVFDGNVNGTSKSLTGLTSGTEYSWKVAANSATNDACDSNFSNEDNFTTCASGFTSLTPTVTADNTGKNGGEALFELSGATSYSVTLKNNSTNAVIAGYNNVSNTSGNITFSGLTASTTYRVEVIAHNACGDNSQTGSETFTTDAATLYTVTFHNAAGSAPAAVTQASEGASVSIPSTSACEGWAFVGWKIGSAQSSTTSDPTSSGTWITSASWPKNYAPDGNIDVYAVFSHTSSGGGETTQTATYGWESTDDATVWTFGTNVSTTTSAKRSGTTAATNGTTTVSVDNWYVKFNDKLAKPQSISCYYTKNSSNNNNSSFFKIQTSTDGSSWTDRATGNGFGSVTKGTYYELSYDLSSLTNVYVRIALVSTNAPRILDDITLTYKAAGGGTTTWRSDPPCASEYTVTYHDNGKTAGVAPDDPNSPYAAGSEVTILGNIGSPVLSKTGKVWSGWNTQSDMNGTTYQAGDVIASINADLDLYPVWLDPPYTVNFNKEGGKSVESTSLTEAGRGLGVVLPNAVPSDACATLGWFFYGWASASVSNQTSVGGFTLRGRPGQTYVPSADNETLHAVYKQGGLDVNGEFTNVTGAGSIVNNGYYLISNVNNTTASVMENAINITGGSTQNIKVSDAAVTLASVNNPNLVWQMKQSSTYWQIYNPLKELYVAAVGTGAGCTLVADGSNDQALWTMSTTGSGNYKFENKGNAAKSINANLSYSDGNGYRCQSSSAGGTTLYLYKAGTSVVTTGTAHFDSNPDCNTYDVTIGSHSGGTVTVNTSTTSPQSFTAGTTINLEATPTSGYNFTSWTITRDDNSSNVTTSLLGAGNDDEATTSFTMPEYDVTVSATFTAIVYHTVTWKNNGVTLTGAKLGSADVLVEHGLKVANLPPDLSSTSDDNCDGESNVFVGWTSNSWSGKQDDAPAILFKKAEDAPAVNADVTYHAVWAKPE